MRIKKAGSNVVPMSCMKNDTKVNNVSKRDIIRMKFLEQSAIYLGVYVENRPKNRLSESLLN